VNKNLLIVSYDFPPVGGVAVRRLLQTIKYLESFGWNMTILTTDAEPETRSLYDPELFAQLPPSACCVRALLPGFMAHARLLILNPTTRWIPFAIWQGWRSIRRTQFGAILATAPVFQNLVVGGVLKELTGVPLVLEFRDAWTAGPLRAERPFRKRILDSALESWLIRRADKVIAATESVTQDFANRYGYAASQGKFLTIANGYDESERTLAASPVPEHMANRSIFRIVYAGSLYGVRTPRYFLAAVRVLLDRRPDLRPRLRLTFVGHSSRFADGETIEDHINRYGLMENVERTGFVSRKESLQYLSRADLLLLLVGIVPAERRRMYGLSAKVFDYVLAQKPVLAVAEEGLTADFVRASQIGEVVSHFDQEGIIHAIERAIESVFYYRPAATMLRQYDCSRLTRRLEAVLLSLGA
jgi:glycosyltransferase involved in cell wall biosynthesis